MDIVVERGVVEESILVILVEMGVMVQILAADLHVITVEKLLTLNALVGSLMGNPHSCLLLTLLLRALLNIQF